ncbi:MAG: type II secretion system GspH family protein [Lentisphaeraceae bacterium]|nr:type II secretion system GspH family protein [Lentisphaeraceae bacterium]
MKKFTILELLVVVAIIAVLASLLLPSISQARIKTLSAVCKSNMKQAHTAMVAYMSSNSLQEPFLFYDGVGDHPWEGFASRRGKKSPSNPAIWTEIYLEESTAEIYHCPLVTTNGSFNSTPRQQQGSSINGFCGTYIYLYGKAARNDDKWANVRKAPLQNAIQRTNSKSEDVVMFDYPLELYEAYKTRFNLPSQWDSQAVHYNALMLDGRVIEPAKNTTKLYKWLFGNSQWGG